MKTAKILTMLTTLIGLSSLPLQASAMATCFTSNNSRRQFLQKGGFLAAGTMPFVAGVSYAEALDMDAFISKELATDTTKKDLSKDEALCKFGEASPQRGDACVRAGMSTKGKSGGVDAYGKVDRGDYVKCKAVYKIVNDKYEKQFICN